ncbi:MAG: beta-lactamase class [Sphingomonadales bacterium]|nr:beta-lactamase class [Sphingomonadales bacterium]
MSVTGRRISSESSRFAALAGIVAIGLASAAIDGASAQSGGGAAYSTRSYPAPSRGYTAPAAPAATAQEATARRILEGQVRALGQSFSGDIGIAVRDVQSGWTTSFDGDTYFPQQSVSKFWVALTAFDKADRGELSLSAPVTLTKSDITLFHQPIAAQIGASGYSTTIGDLIFRAITTSDNTCNDFVLWKAGGPDAVRSFLRSRGIEGIRFGPGERLLQSQIAGIQWQQSWAYDGGFYKARNALPLSARRAAFERYIANPMDGATPEGIVDALARLKRGELLSPASTQRLLSIMGNTKTGAQRLKGGLAPGWHLSHKTGTGQVLGGEQAGYNDIGLLTGPDGRSYAVAVMIRRTSAPLGQRMAAMQSAVRAVISFDQNMSSYGMARYGVAEEPGSR